MVLEIRFSNFFSINEEVILDLRAGNLNSAKTKTLSENVIQFDDIEVLKSVALYGANASGKSNIIKTIRFCNAMIFNSHSHNENSIFNFKKFKFSGYSNKPSTYSIRFVIDNIEYSYSFSLDQAEILTESLYYYPKGKVAKVFERKEKAGKTKKEKYSFGTSVIKRPLDVAENTSNKTLYISRASQMDREIPKKVFNFFHSSFILHHSNYGVNHFELLLKSHRSQLLQALQLADSDIIDFKPTFKKEKRKNLKANLVTEEAYFE